MSTIIKFFYLILYQPILNGLIVIYNTIAFHDMGVAVILLTLIIRLIIFPSSIKTIKSQKALNRIQPKMKEIQKKYKDDKEKQSRELFKLYKEEKVSPFSGCLPLLLQLPILIALYQVFLDGLKPESLIASLYSFVANPGLINFNFLGVIDLSKFFMIKIGQTTIYYWPALILSVLAGVAQFFQTKITIPQQPQKNKKDASVYFQKQMLYFMPAFTVFIILKFGSVIGLYWLVTTISSIVEYKLVNKR